MFPLPIISNTSNLPPRDEKALLEQEIVYLNCELIDANTQPRNTRPYVYERGVIVSTTGIMWGSSFNTRYTFDSNFHFAYRHAFPTTAVYNYYINNPTQVSFAHQGTLTTYPSYPGVNRYGYTSSSYGSYSGFMMDLFVYWDETEQRVMQYNPSTNSTPTYRYP